MHINAQVFDEGQQVQSKVCIVGAGAAGITLALRLAELKIPAILLESGDFDLSSNVQQLYDGQVDEGTPFPAHYLKTSRLRYFGGTTNHWGGYCRPLDAIDFSRREWVPHSGWPVSRSDLDSHFEKACQLCEVHNFSYEQDNTLERLGIGIQLGADAGLQTQILHQGPPTRFGTKYRSALVDAADIQVITNASAVDLVADESGKITEVVASTIEKKRFRVVADVVILAMGAVENARILLASRGRFATGVGNVHDNVGRYFMDHLGFPNVGNIIFNKRYSFAQFHAKNEPVSFIPNEIFPVISLTDEVLRREKLQRLSFYIRVRDDNPPHSDAVKFSLKSFGGHGSNKLEVRDEEPAEYRLQIWHAEQRPNPKSRVVLDSEVDALGVQKSRLAWAYDQADVESIQKSVEVLGSELGRLGIGRVRSTYTAQQLWEGSEYGAHHIGTTRMSADPKNGVVDANCLVHSTKNLFVAGSSIFPTMGHVNPTLTIVAFAQRLADHLADTVLN